MGKLEEKIEQLKTAMREIKDKRALIQPLLEQGKISKEGIDTLNNKIDELINQIKLLNEITKESKIDSLNVLNLKDLKIPEYPKSIKIDNLKDIPQPNITIEKVILPKGLLELDQDKIINELSEAIIKAQDLISKTFIQNKEPQDYIPVRIVKADGSLLRFEDPPWFAGNRSSGGSTSDLAKEVTLQEVLTKLG